MTTVGSSWVELDRWSDATGYGNNAEWRVLARSTQDISANTSKVYFKLQKSVSANSAWNSNNLDFSISGTGEGGDSHNATQTWVYGSVSSTSWADVGGDDSDMYWSGVRHANDGSCSISATASGDRWNGSTFSTSISITLPTIPRASVASANPNPMTIGSSTNTVTINTNRKSNSFTHDLTLTCGAWTSSQTGIGASTTFTIPYSVIAQFSATSKTASCTITCVTKNGNTTIGTKTSTFTLQVDSAVDHPNIGTVTITDTNAKSAAIESAGTYIRKASDLSVSIPLTVSGSYTELASAQVTCGNVVQNYVLSGTSQTITFTYDKIDTNGLSIVVTDKRGNTATLTKSWNLVPYLDLTVTGTVDRASETGNTINYKLTGDCFAGSFGLQTNEITTEYRYKLHSSNTYGAWATIETFTPSGSGEEDYDRSGTLSGFSYDQQYDIQFRVTDLFTSAETRELSLTKGIPVYGNGEDFFAVYGDLHIHDRTDPTQYWTLSQANDLVTAISDIQSALAMSNVSASGSYTNSSASQAFSVTGSGIVIFNVYAVSASNQDDTGQVEAYVQLLNSSNVLQATLARDGNRLSSSSTFRNAANASGAYYFDGGENNRLKFYTSNTKNGSTSWRIQIVALGCTVTAL